MRPEYDFEIDFGDTRLSARLVKTVAHMTNNTQSSILSCGEGRSSAKGFYRLLSNDKFKLSKLQASAKQATISRMGGHQTVLLVQDTMNLNLNGHKKTEGLGYCSEHTKGINVHNCAAFTVDGLPLGLVAQDYETRAEAKSSLTAKEKAARPIEEKESFVGLKCLLNQQKTSPMTSMS